MLKMSALAEPRREDAPGIWAWCSSLHSASQHTSSGNTGGRRTVVALLRGGHQGTRSAWDRLVPRLRRFSVSRERARTSPSIVSGEARRGHNESPLRIFPAPTTRKTRRQGQVGNKPYVSLHFLGADHYAK